MLNVSPNVSYSTSMRNHVSACRVVSVAVSRIVSVLHRLGEGKRYALCPKYKRPFSEFQLFNQMLLSCSSHSTFHHYPSFDYDSRENKI